MNQFNDIIDMNDNYITDQIYAAAAEKLNYNCNDYKFVINGKFDLIYNINYGLNY